MDCREYIEKYLAADADRELDAAERRAADAHLDGCEGCRAILADERALKALIRDRLRKASVPIEVRAAIRATLDRAETPVSISPSISGRARLAAGPRLSVRAGVGLTAIAAALAFVLVMRSFSNRTAPASDTDLVVAAFTESAQHFDPNPLCLSYGAAAEHYHSARMPAFIWNFEPFGFHLVGGRIGKLADGRPATLTLYRNGSSSIMCIRFHTAGFKIPAEAHLIAGDRYAYSHQGSSVVLTVNGDWICALVTNLPAPQFEKDITFLES